MFKLLRLLRLARMARLMRALPELVAMIKGVKVASRAVGSALLMLVMMIYLFSIIMFSLLQDTKVTCESHNPDACPYVQLRFLSLPQTMLTLLIDGTFLDNIGLLSRMLIDISAHGPFFVLQIFVLGSALTVMNMLIGVLCEVVSAVKSAEEENSAIRMVKDNVLNMLMLLDEDESGMISSTEIQGVLNDRNALDVLQSLNVDVKILMEQLDMFFEESEELSIHRIMELILMLRGDRPPTMKDMLHGQAYNRWRMTKVLMRDSGSRRAVNVPQVPTPSSWGRAV
eukprot:gnl/TRDRNA2_/TRDRNA2_139564_c0_seq2.p1 gnl/TRDRNA2_/TRDRNA2_139564_c0~~gnl/TRDRNA2_/TRDRNA2_139564_c0_seq2.p1  ORF type:complete len:301 (+),score=62.12 gnl/TRDRNA2_/TRDRNA2_139564_c0_seq2:52-903(+)